VLGNLHIAGGGTSSDLWQFNTLVLRWIKLDAAAGVQGAGPSARFGHAMTSIGASMLIFGGGVLT